MTKLSTSQLKCLDSVYKVSLRRSFFFGRGVGRKVKPDGDVLCSCKKKDKTHNDQPLKNLKSIQPPPQNERHNDQRNRRSIPGIHLSVHKARRVTDLSVQASRKVIYLVIPPAGNRVTELRHAARKDELPKVDLTSAAMFSI